MSRRCRSWPSTMRRLLCDAVTLARLALTPRAQGAAENLIDPARKRLLWIGQHRRAKTLLRFFRWFGAERTAALAFICSDMWKPYLQVVDKKAGHALHILDRFHIAKHMSDAIDQVRRVEVHALRQQGRQPLLTKTRWL